MGIQSALLMPAACSGIAVFTGIAVCWAQGAEASACATTGLAWVLGSVVAFALGKAAQRLDLRRNTNILMGIVLVALLACFVGGGQDGVHRWISAGSLRVNAAALFLPLGVVALGHGNRWRSWAAALPVMVILLMQPDASQATAFASAGIFVLVHRSGLMGREFAASAVLALLAAATFLRADPLGPVPYVEQVLGLAYRVHPAVAVVLSGAVLLTCLVPAKIPLPKGPPSRKSAVALSVYLVIAAAAPLIGNYPVPFAGLSASPILGYWLAIGLLLHEGSEESRSRKTALSG